MRKIHQNESSMPDLQFGLYWGSYHTSEGLLVDRCIQMCITILIIIVTANICLFMGQELFQVLYIFYLLSPTCSVKLRIIRHQKDLPSIPTQAVQLQRPYPFSQGTLWKKDTGEHCRRCLHQCWAWKNSQVKRYWRTKWRPGQWKWDLYLKRKKIYTRTLLLRDITDIKESSFPVSSLGDEKNVGVKQRDQGKGHFGQEFGSKHMGVKLEMLMNYLGRNFCRESGRSGCLWPLVCQCVWMDRTKWEVVGFNEGGEDGQRREVCKTSGKFHEIKLSLSLSTVEGMRKQRKGLLDLVKSSVSGLVRLALTPVHRGGKNWNDLPSILRNTLSKDLAIGIKRPVAS